MRGGACFRHAVSLLHEAAHAGGALADDVGAERRRAREQLADRREVAAVHARTLREREHDRRHDVQHRGAVTLDEIQIAIEIEPRHDDERCARPEAEQHDHDEAVDVEEGQEADERILAVAQVTGRVDLQNVRDEITVRQHHAFRKSRSAARVRKRDDVVRVDGNRRRRARLHQEAVEWRCPRHCAERENLFGLCAGGRIERNVADSG